MQNDKHKSHYHFRNLFLLRTLWGNPVSLAFSVWEKGENNRHKSMKYLFDDESPRRGEVQYVVMASWFGVEHFPCKDGALAFTCDCSISILPLAKMAHFSRDSLVLQFSTICSKILLIWHGVWKNLNRREVNSLSSELIFKAIFTNKPNNLVWG